jgi:hypothetical protein
MRCAALLLILFAASFDRFRWLFFEFGVEAPPDHEVVMTLEYVLS